MVRMGYLIDKPILAGILTYHGNKKPLTFAFYNAKGLCDV